MADKPPTTGAAVAPATAKPATPRLTPQQANQQKTPPAGNAGGATPASGTTAPAAGTPAQTTYQGALNSQFGQNNPFGQQSWYGGNPLETAQGVADRGLQKNLADVRSRFAGNGTANSSRQAIAEGTAVGEYGTGLADVLASRGQAARASDADRGLQALLGAGSQDLASRQLALQANQQLGGYGTGLTGIGSQETEIPNLGALLAMLGTFSRTTGAGKQAQNSSGGKLK